MDSTSVRGAGELPAVQILEFRLRYPRMVAGIALVAGGVLLVIATVGQSGRQQPAVPVTG
jgi:hypothetical protein